MEQREKLIELIETAFERQETDKCRECGVYDCVKCVSEYISDHLLANGVVVLPCHVVNASIVTSGRTTLSNGVFVSYISANTLMLTQQIIAHVQNEKAVTSDEQIHGG